MRTDRVEEFLAPIRAARLERTRAMARRTYEVGLANLADLLDEGSLVEYGGLAVAAQRARRTEEELVATTPADGIVTGIGRVTTAPGTRASSAAGAEAKSVMSAVFVSVTMGGPLCGSAQ